MRGVADQRQPLADEGARDEIAERKRARLVERLDLAEVQAKTLLEFAVKFLFAQSDDARGLGALLGPHQRRAVAGQRQDRKGPGGEKMFLGAAVMIALVADGDDDAGLVVVPAMGGDARRARAISSARRRRRPKGSPRSRCRRPASRRRRRCANSKLVTAVALRSMPSASARFDQRVDQMAVLDHMRERLARLDIRRRRSGTPAGSRPPAWNW